jgi:glycine/D-amino acid oxidase-like deaminating enzyme
VSSNGTRTADIVIVGAGVMGTSIAFQLAQRKAGRVLVLDKDHVASGGSGRSSALIRMHYSFPAEVKLALLSLRMFEQWQEVVGESTFFHKTGFVRIVHPNETDRLRSNVEMQRSLGANVQLISRQQLRELEPDWLVDDVEFAAYEPDSGYGDGAGVANDFLARARDLGVAYSPHTRVTQFLRRNGFVYGVATDRGEVHASLVIAAMGPWTRPLFEEVGYPLPIGTEFHQVAILRNAADMKPAGSACIDSGTTTYFRPDGQDKVLVGDFYGTRPIDADNFPQRASDESLEELIERASRRLPKLENAEVMRGVTGVYDMTPDSRPLLGEIPGIHGLYVCAGFSGMGFKISPAIGIVMSELLLDGAAKAVDISAFSPNRFVEKRLIHAEFEYVDD